MSLCMLFSGRPKLSRKESVDDDRITGAGIEQNKYFVGRSRSQELPGQARTISRTNREADRKVCNYNGLEIEQNKNFVQSGGGENAILDRTEAFKVFVWQM